MIWFFLGLGLGIGIGINIRDSKTPDELEKCNLERSQQEIDIAYYKKLTKNLVEENKQLRGR